MNQTNVNTLKITNAAVVSRRIDVSGFDLLAEFIYALPKAKFHCKVKHNDKLKIKLKLKQFTNKVNLASSDQVHLLRDKFYETL